MAEQQSTGNYWEQESLSKEDLINNPAFLRDASVFLRKRTKENISTSDKEKLYNEFVEYNRSSTVNEVSAWKNLSYVKDKSTTDVDKERMGKILTAFERLDDADTGLFEYIKDYGGALLSSPSTYLGFGAGKVAGFAAGKGVSALAKQAATKGVARVAGSKAGRIGSSVAGTAALEGGIEFGAEGYRQRAEVEALTRRTEGSTVPEKDEVDRRQQYLSAGLAAAGSAIPAGLFRARGIKLKEKEAAFLKEAEEAGAARATTANKKADATLKDNAGLADEVNASSKTLRQAAKLAREAKASKNKYAPLDPEQVARGRETAQDILDDVTGADSTARVATKEEGASAFGGKAAKVADDSVEFIDEAAEIVDEPVITRVIGEDLEIKLKVSTLKRVSALAIELAKGRGAKTFKIAGQDKPPSITQILANELMLKKKSIIAAAEETAKTASKESGGEVAALIGKEAGDAAKSEADTFVRNLMDEYDLGYSDLTDLFVKEFSDAGRTLQIASQSRKSFSDLFEGMNRAAQDNELDKAVDVDIGVFRKGYEHLKNLDQVARGMMTMQPATTVRNTIGAGLRVAAYAVNNTVAGGLQLGVGTAVGNKELRRAGLLRLEKPATIFKYMLARPDEAAAIRTLAKQTPEGKAAFRAMADITNATPKDRLGKVVTEVGEDGKTTERFVSATRATDWMVKLVRYGNALNTASDNFFKTVIFVSELGEQVGGSKKLIKLAKEGKFNTIEPDKIAKAADEALFNAYQKGYEQGTLGKGFIDAFSTPFTTPFIPFPRFLVNALEFTYQHAPIIGAIQRKEGGGLIGQGKVFGKTNRDVYQRLAQQVTGFGMLYGAIQLRTAIGESTAWHEIKDKYGEVTDNLALYGPFGIWMLTADVVMRATNEAKRDAERKGLDPDDVSLYDLDFSDRQHWKEAVNEISIKDTGREALKALFGTTFKTGVNVNLLQKSAEEVLETGDAASVTKLMADVMGNWMNRFTVPVGLAKDVLGTFDEDYLAMQDNRGVNLWAQMWKRAGRSIPKALRSEEGLFSFTAEDLKASPTRVASPRKGKLPLMKQFTGRTPVEDRNILEKELIKLYGGRGYTFKLFPKKSGDPRLRKVMDQFYGQISEQELIPLINSALYRKTPDNAGKRLLLKREIDAALAGQDVTDFFASWAVKNIPDEKERKDAINMAYKSVVSAFGNKDLRTVTRRNYETMRVKQPDRNLPKWDDLDYDIRLDYLKQEKEKQK